MSGHPDNDDEGENPQQGDVLNFPPLGRDGIKIAQIVRNVEASIVKEAPLVDALVNGAKLTRCVYNHPKNKERYLVEPSDHFARPSEATWGAMQIDRNASEEEITAYIDGNIDAAICIREWIQGEANALEDELNKMLHTQNDLAFIKFEVGMIGLKAKEVGSGIPSPEVLFSNARTFVDGLLTTFDGIIESKDGAPSDYWSFRINAEDTQFYRIKLNEQDSYSVGLNIRESSLKWMAQLRSYLGLESRPEGRYSPVKKKSPIKK